MTRIEELAKIEQALRQGKVERLDPGVNKGFKEYLRASRKAYSLARGASLRKTGKGDRAGFDLGLMKR